jgi:ketol-acid reductoisomerase
MTIYQSHGSENRFTIEEGAINAFRHFDPLKLGLSFPIMITLIRSFKLVLFMMRLTIIGFGNQAKAWAQNLQDSGFPFRVALKPDSPSFEKAIALGIETVEIGSADFFKDRAFVLLTPDHTHHDFMTNYGHLFAADTMMIYNHGFSLTKNQFQTHFPHMKHVLFAVKAIGSEVRKQYLVRGKLGAVYSLEHVKSDTTELRLWLEKLAHSLGINFGLHPTTFEHETQADLYSEQGLLCSILPYTAGEMFSQLVENGVEPELAFFEVWHELKLIANAMVDKGPEGFFELISPNALVGSEKGYQKLFNADFRQNLKSLMSDIKTGKFNDELENTDVEELRKIIRARWNKSPLMKTFRDIHARYPDEKA